MYTTLFHGRHTQLFQNFQIVKPAVQHYFTAPQNQYIEGLNIFFSSSSYIKKNACHFNEMSFSRENGS